MKFKSLPFSVSFLSFLVVEEALFGRVDHSSKIVFQMRNTFHSLLCLQWRISHPSSKPHIRIIMFCLRHRMTSKTRLLVHHTNLCKWNTEWYCLIMFPLDEVNVISYRVGGSRRSIYKTHIGVRTVQVCPLFCTFFFLSFHLFFFSIFLRCVLSILKLLKQPDCEFVTNKCCPPTDVERKGVSTGKTMSLQMWSFLLLWSS